MFSHLVVMKFTIKEKQPIANVAKTLNLQPQLASLYQLTKRLNETYKLLINQLPKRAWQKCKVKKHTNQFTKNLNET
jgi:hypothetical protein